MTPGGLVQGLILPLVQMTGSRKRALLPLLRLSRHLLRLVLPLRLLR